MQSVLSHFPTSSRRSWLLVLIPAIVYLAGAIPNIQLPGVYYDEVLQVLPAMRAVGYDLNPDFMMMPGSQVGIGSFRIPVMTVSYLGALETMLFVPVFLILPPTVMTIRGVFILLGLLSIVLTFVWSKQMLGTLGAFVTSLLLATTATYVMYTRADNGPVDTMMLIKLGMLIAFTSWWRTGKAASFVIGAFLMGLGVYDKMNFGWLIIAGAVTLLIFAPRETWKRLYGRWGMLVVGAVAAAVGAAPAIVYVIFSGGGPFSQILGTFDDTVFRVNNSAFLTNLGIRTGSFVDLISGYDALNNYMVGAGGTPYQPFPLNLQPGLLLLAIGAPVLWFASTRKRFDNRLRLNLALTVLIVLLLALSTVTPTGFTSHHLIIISVFPELLMANAMLTFLDPPERKNRVLAGLAVGLVGLQILFQVGVVVRNHQVLQETGGAGVWSAAIYELSDYLVEQGHPVICMDWGLCNNLQMLSQGRLKTYDLWRDYLYPLTDTGALEALLLDQNNRFVFFTPQFSGSTFITDELYARQTFFDTAKKLDLTVEQHVIPQMDGEPLYEIFWAVPAAA